MAGYSGTPLLKKIGVKPGSSLCLLSSPFQVRELFPDLDASVQVLLELSAGQSLDVILYFTTSLSSLQASFANYARFLKNRGALWIAWPKKSSKILTDVDENQVRAVGLAAGLVDVKVCAIDETWSGLKFVYRIH